MAFSFCSSWLVHHLANSTAVPLFLAYLAIATLWPPRVELPGPVSPGSGATANLPLIFEDASFSARA